MPVDSPHFEPGHRQFITTSTYRRTKLFHSDRFRRNFLEMLGQLGRVSANRLGFDAPGVSSGRQAHTGLNRVGARLVRALRDVSCAGQASTRLNRAKAPAASGGKSDS
jgi:hypothetical protein